MKRGTIALSILLGGLLVTNPISDMVFAESTNNKNVIEYETNTNEVASEETNKVEEVEKEETTGQPNIETEVPVIKEETKVEEEKEEIVEDEVVTEEVKEEAKEENKTENTVEVIEVLNQEQALELLQMYNNDTTYSYQGDEADFDALTQQGLSGYVFLTDYQTDLGLFVDKNTADVYYFHPSGYLELLF